MKSPTKSAIRKARLKVGLSQKEAGATIYKAERTWQQWERGDRSMDPAFWELFNIKIKDQEAF